MKKNDSLLKLLTWFVLFPGIVNAQNAIQKNKLAPTYQIRESKATTVLKTLLESQRTVIAEKKLGFLVSNTAVSGKDLRLITGVLPLTQSQIEQVQKVANNKAPSAMALNLKKAVSVDNCFSSPSYDSRNGHLVPAIRYQQCGNCWAYSAIGALECSDVKVNGIFNPNNVSLSEKQMVACSGAGNCSGGWPYKVFEYLLNTKVKVMNSNDDPDDGTDRPCPQIPATANVQLADWGIVDVNNNLGTIPPVAKIKEAICTYGSVSACILATPLFQNFAGGGIFYERPSNYGHPSINHAIVIIGWDDQKQAWLIRNSWSTAWGDGGYAWVKYNTNNVGYGAIWCVAERNVAIAKLSKQP